MTRTKESDRIVAFHIDLNFVSLRPDYLRRWIGQLADMGYNAILWELENKVRWETCPQCVWPEAMTKVQFREILDYSRRVGLQPIPLLQTIGHAEYVLLHKEYHDFRELPDRHDCYCTSHPGVRSFLKKWIEEYCELFGELKQFHLGGDEAYVFGRCPKCAGRIKEIGRNGLYAEHIADLAQPLAARNIRPGIWGDMILHKSDEGVEIIPNSFVIWNWNYRDGTEPPPHQRVAGRGSLTPDQFDRQLLEKIPELLDEKGQTRPFYTAAMLQRLGFDVVLCSATRSGGDSVFCGRHSMHAGNVIGAAQTAGRLGLLGTCVTSWAIRQFSYEIQHPWMLLGPAALANPQAGKDDLLRQVAERLFGRASLEFFQAIEQIGTAFLFARTRGGTAQAIQWNGLKDSLPAPKGYLADKLRQWTAPDCAEQWKDETECIEQALPTITEGQHRLQQFFTDAQKGLPIIREWLRAAYHQTQHARVAGDVIARLGGKPAVDPAEMRQLLTDSRIEFMQWASRWMTPQSAEENAGLIFDCVLEYYESL